MMKAFLVSMTLASLAAGEIAMGDGEHAADLFGARELQGDFQGDIGAIDVGALCGGFMAEGVLDCECERSGSLDVKAECSQNEQQCALDNTTCLDISFETVRTPLTPDTQASDYTITCTTWSRETDGEVCEFETCVDVEPTRPGFWNETLSCGASLAGQLCQGCSSCEMGDFPKISVDCENVAKGAKMTCGNVTFDADVGSIGLAVLIFDNGYPQPGTCPGAGSAAVNHLGFSTFLSILSGIFVSSIYTLLA